jgi:transposase
MREVPNVSNRDFSYKVQVKVGLRELKIELEKKRAGRFILATNVLDKMELITHTEVLSKYREQQLVERGFRFLKDPLFLTDSVFM